MFSTPVREYMSDGLVAVRPDTPLPDVLRTLRERDISAVAVVDPSGEAVGCVSLTDLLRSARITLPAPGARPHVIAPDQHARDVMRSPVIALDETDSIRDAAKLMLDEHIHRVFVRRGGRVVAASSTRDLMRAVLFHRIDAPVKTVMSTPVESISVGDSIDEALERLTQANLRGLVVVDGTMPVGVFTQTEAIYARALPRELRSGAVEQVMSYETICFDAATPLYRVAGSVIAMKCRRVFVVEHRALVGIVTGYDLARVITELD